MTIQYEKEGRVAIFTLNSPEALNSIDPASLKEFSNALIEFREDDDLWIGVITGAGEKAFCAGADIKTYLPQRIENRGQAWRSPPTILNGLDLWKPLIAAVNGICMGGGLEIALACDIRIASENATFAFPEVRLGVIPGWGGTQRLTRLVPWARAAEMLLTGRPIDSQEAHRIGLLNRVVPSAELMTEARKMAEILCEPGPLGVRAAKQAMVQGANVSLQEGIQIESILLDFCLGTEDFKEGRQAFSEKRKPNFTGK